MKIESYHFGEIVIDGVPYNKDLKIIKGKIIEDWWRSQGHLLQVSDIVDIVAAKPNTLVVGTGAYGRMVLKPGLLDELGSKGIYVEFLPTELAVGKFNELASELGVDSVAFAAHLTC
ncbi:MAG: hypothetical protein GWP10_03860 [Nitrospiraceae bacterium]|nr:hypothetical protein [Nitrospiraceae bacterium]